MGLLRLKVGGQYVTVAQGPAGPIGPQGPPGPEIAVLTTAQRDALTGANLYEGKVIYNTDLDIYQGYVGGTWGDFITSKGGTMTSRLTLKSVRETIVNHGAVASGATVTLDFSAASMHIMDGSAGPITIATSNGADGDSIYLRIYQSTARAVTWPAGTKWNGGTAPTLSVGYNVISFIREGTFLMASFVGTFS